MLLILKKFILLKYSLFLCYINFSIHRSDWVIHTHTRTHSSPYSFPLWFFLKDCFWYGPFLSLYLNLSQHGFYFMGFFKIFWLQGMWNLSSLTRDWTHTLGSIGTQWVHWKAKSQPLDSEGNSSIVVYHRMLSIDPCDIHTAGPCCLFFIY